MLLVWLFRQEKKCYLEILSFSRQTMWKDIGITFLTMIVLMPLSIFPNQWLATWLFGFSEIAYSLFFRPLPLWAGWSAFYFRSRSLSRNCPPTSGMSCRGSKSNQAMAGLHGERRHSSWRSSILRFRSFLTGDLCSGDLACLSL